MVGDRYETDILGGANAGIRTIAVLTGISSAEVFAIHSSTDLGVSRSERRAQSLAAGPPTSALCPAL